MTAAAQGGRIGPNALLQLVPVLEAAGGPALRRDIFALGGVTDLPSGDGLIDEAPVAAVHQALRAQLPDQAPALAWAAGVGTADYILAHRIPAAAQWLLRHLPARLAGPLLVRAIARNAWTFAGSGRFSVVRVWPPVFEIADNPVVRGERADHPICHWHAAVFQRLFQVLVHPEMTCTETDCGAAGAGACRFELTRRA